MKHHYGFPFITALLATSALALWISSPKSVKPLSNTTIIAKNNLGMEHWPSGVHIELKAPDQVSQ